MSNNENNNNNNKNKNENNDSDNENNDSDNEHNDKNIKDQNKDNDIPVSDIVERHRKRINDLLKKIDDIKKNIDMRSENSKKLIDNIDDSTKINDNDNKDGLKDKNYDNWKLNPFANRKLTPLQHSNKIINKNLKIYDISRNIFRDLSNSKITLMDILNNNKNNNSEEPNDNNLNIKEKNLKTNDTELNMTINNILNKLENRRKKNNEELTKDFLNVKKNLDSNKSLDISNTEIVTYNKTSNVKSSLDDFLLNIDKRYNTFHPSSTLSNNSSFFTRHRRRHSIYYPAPLSIPPPLPKIEKTKVNINVEIESLDDLLKLTEDYPIKFDVEYNINMEAIHNIKEPLTELKNMIGMHGLKNAVVDQILYFIQEFHKINGLHNQDFMHTVIYGPPGTGKTETAKIMGKIFSKLGILKKKFFKKATRADLIAGYLGQTALKTRDVIKECLGGVLFIDEAYALGNPEKRDSFAKECIDTLCEGLSDHKEELMVIIAGYEEELKSCFFAYNQGLDSRFTWRFKTDDYTYKELFLIFEKKVKDIGWSLNKKVSDEWFKEKMDTFEFYGRDVETLLAKVKIAHGRRVFCLPEEKKTIISKRDMNKGYKIYLDNSDKKNDEKTRKEILSHMYV